MAKLKSFPLDEEKGKIVTISEYILKLKPYKAGKSIEEIQRVYGIQQVIKLGSNECPFGVSPKVKLALEKAIPEIHRYPDSSYHEISEVIGSYWKIPSNQVLIGNGSNELIDLLVRVYAEPKDQVVVSQTGFIAYSVCAQASRLDVVRALEDENFNLNIDDFLQKARDLKSRIGFIANPNNPTGNYLNKSQLEYILNETAQLKNFTLVIDEAYNEFVRAADFTSATKYLSQFPHLVILKTFSKVFGLAGLRMGALFGSVSMVELLNRVRLPFNVSQLAVVAAQAALEDKAFTEACVQKTWAGIDFWIEGLNKLPVKVYPSQGNFILINLKKECAPVEIELLKRGVILRPVGNYGLPNHLRISVGTPQENAIALQALREVLN